MFFVCRFNVDKQYEIRNNGINFQKFWKHGEGREYSVVVSNWGAQRTFSHLERNQSDTIIHRHHHHLYLTSYLCVLSSYHLIMK